MYFNIFYKFSLAISFLSCSDGNSLAFFMRLFKKSFSYSSIFYCSCLISICNCAFLTFRLLLCCEDYCRLLEASAFGSVDLLIFAVEFCAIPVLAPKVLVPVFLLRFFFSRSLSLRRYSAAPGTSWREWISMASLSSGRQEKGFIIKLLNYLSTFLLMSSERTSYSLFFYSFRVSSISQAEANTPESALGMRYTVSAIFLC